MRWPFVSRKKYDRLKAEAEWLSKLCHHYHKVVERQDFELTHNRGGKGLFVPKSNVVRFKVVK
ncbi:hypothetical protein LZD49_33610 [Dyadobacter sp. CY261]|uniref:hypothetical protein n=1 Tax=Dyadobacter sp. CY261 TaxID=2907203 RepID=UPI001F3B2780|nr:hypothetical protein [Dyadobacter sp. CY261]MCF0075465.1 hypothetical protein [Dyadobacter sp. CY261]